MIGLTSLMIIAATLAVDAWFPNSFLIVPAGGAVLVLNLMRFWFTPQLTKAADFLFRWRWVLALLVFSALVIGRIHFSSIPAYGVYYAHSPTVEDSVLFGVARGSRADEFNVQLPYYFSQFYNNYQQISHQMSVSGQDMVLGYNAPVLAPSLIGKPQTWGYLLFGNTLGLSWYFAFKAVITFMGALELFYILTGSRPISVFGGFFILYAPGMQWWFSPHFFDVMMWAMLLFVVGYYFFAWQGWKKWGMSFLAICTLSGFTLAIFPSLQVPCGLLMLALLLACLWRDRKKLEWKMSNLFNILFVLIGTGTLLGWTFWSMRDQLSLVLGTVYPGSRISVGGYGRWYQLFINPGAPIQPLETPNLLNNSEFSTFNHYGLACLIFYPILWFYLRREKNGQQFVGNVFFIALVIELLFLMVPFPEWLVKITLLSLCNRMHTVFGWSAALFTVWFTRVVWTTPIPWKKTMGLLVCVLYGLLSLLDTRSIMMPSFQALVGRDYFVIVPIILAAVFWLAFTRWRQLFFAAMTAWTVLTGVLVNPIVQGTAGVTDYPLVEKARQCIEQEPDAWWLATGTLTTQNLLLANGAKVLNATNFYPDYDKWKLIDPQLKADNFVNRYANIQVYLRGDNEPTEFKNPVPDGLQVFLSPKDLIKLNTRYLVGKKTDKAALEAGKIDYQVLYTDPVSEDMIFKLTPKTP